MSLFKITPEHLTEYVNFHFNDKKWSYDKADTHNIASLQAEGSAKIFNLLIDNGIALLADEVGMGKTYEALAIMVSLWRQKPNAKILVYVPNEIVAKKWMNDYYNFLRKNYIENDDLVKSSLNEEPLHKAVYCHNHIELMEQINKKWISFLICKTSSLSGLLSPKINNETLKRLEMDLSLEISENSSDEVKAQWMYKLARSFNDKAYEKLSENGMPPFDLLVYDEAHYLRRTEPSSTSNKSIVAHAFFAGRNIRGENPYNNYQPIASKTLLMTATPTHSSNVDVKTVTSLFKPELRNEEPDKILDKICVRRYRRLENKIKYEYREENPEPVALETLQQKLFFAAYQKSLVLNKAQAAREGKTSVNNPYRILFGYLEGFEFIPNIKEKDKNTDDKNKENLNGDFEETEDSALIKDLSRKYIKAYRKIPAHPKYEQIIKNILPTSEVESFEKKLVFVRRIPSVNEISSRLVREYDKLFKQELKQVVGAKKINRVNLRKFFYNLGKDDVDEIGQINVNNEDSNNDSNPNEVPKSKVLDLFTVKKDGKYKSTDCSNFRLRFIKDEQIFSVFFQPALDYRYAKYSIHGFITKTQNNKTRRLYTSTIKTLRKSKIKDYTTNLKIGIKHETDDLQEFRGNTIELDTLISIWLRKVSFDDTFEIAKDEYEHFSISEKEGFSNYLEAGILFSSSYIIKFYTYYHKLRDKKGVELYTKFCEKIEKEINTIGLSNMISRAILTFRLFYRKELGLTEKQLLNEKNWNFLKSTIPVYPYNGATKRPSIVKAFNTPFYPNALIATSVLQEGVDLHYHCSNVIHYGIAWTPGDNEQRDGRVDRLFGKIHNEIKVNPNAKLPIFYPYLQDTLDQYQLQRFIKRKYQAEKLLDKLKTANVSKEVSLHEEIDENWIKYFNKPKKVNNIVDPYAVKDSDFVDLAIPNLNIQKSNVFKLKDALTIVFNTVKHSYGYEVVYYQYNGNQKADSLVCAIKHIRNNERHQPILIELHYFEAGLTWINRPTYLIKIKTPLCSSDNCLTNLVLTDDLIRLYESNPILKMNYSPDTKGYFKYYVSSELPVFIVENNSINLSGDELIIAIKNVISFADNLENTLFNGEKDIKNEDIIDESNTLNILNETNNDDSKLLGGDRKPKKEIVGWSKSSNGNYFYKTKKTLTTDYEDILRFNDKNHLIRKHRVKNDVFLQVGLYANDALDKEFELFEKVIKNKI